MQHCCATPTNKNSSSNAFSYHNAQLHTSPSPSPLRVRSAHCFSEAAKLLIKAFAFYIWRTRTRSAHRHASIYICRAYIFISYMGACHLCGRFGHNRAASYATKMRVCSSFSASLVTRFACHATQSRDFSPTTRSPHYTLLPPLLPLAAYPVHREFVRN